MITISKKYFDLNNFAAIFFFIILYLLIAYYNSHFIITKSLYLSSFDSQISYNRINQLFFMRQRWQWVGFTLVPIILFLRICLTSACLSIGCFLSDFKLSFSNLFRTALVAEICLAFGMAVRIIWLTFVPPNTITDFQYFSPLSLAQLIGPRSIPKYLLYLCQTINLFEIAYWLLLAAGLVAFLEKPFGKMFKLVMSSYGLGLLLWIVFVSYLTVTFSA